MLRERESKLFVQLLSLFWDNSSALDLTKTILGPIFLSKHTNSIEFKAPQKKSKSKIHGLSRSPQGCYKNSRPNQICGTGTGQNCILRHWLVKNNSLFFSISYLSRSPRTCSLIGLTMSPSHRRPLQSRIHDWCPHRRGHTHVGPNESFI